MRTSCPPGPSAQSGLIGIQPLTLFRVGRGERIYYSYHDFAHNFLLRMKVPKMESKKTCCCHGNWELFT